MVVDVRGTIANIESTFHVKMQRYQHPTENRTFFGPDAEPSVGSGPCRSLDICGLDNFALPHPKAQVQIAVWNRFQELEWFGTGRALSCGRDFRAAYCPQVTLDGSGQTDRPSTRNLTAITRTTSPATAAKPACPAPQLTEVLLDGVSATPPSGDYLPGRVA
jgi:hypothetical protein